jgi:hypothetical protein
MPQVAGSASAGAYPDHPLDPSPASARTTRGLALAGILGIGSFALLVAVLHVVRSDFDPLSRTISEYASGNYGWLVQVATLGLGLGSLAVVAALVRTARPVPSRLGVALLLLWSVAVSVAAVFPSDLIDLAAEMELSAAGAVHVLAVLVALPSFAVGVPLVTRRLRRSSQWRPFRRPVGALALISVGGLVVFVAVAVVTATGATRPLLGLGERILLAAYLGWLLAVAVLTRRVGRT